MNNCDNCRFWVEMSENHILGTCRRYPPTSALEASQFPVTAFIAWCGEHQPNQAVIKKFRDKMLADFGKL